MVTCEVVQHHSSLEKCRLYHSQIPLPVRRAGIEKATHHVCKNVEIGALIQNMKCYNYFGRHFGICLKSLLYTCIMTQLFYSLVRETKVYVHTKAYMQMLITVLPANQLPSTMTDKQHCGISMQYKFCSVIKWTYHCYTQQNG